MSVWVFICNHQVQMLWMSHNDWLLILSYVVSLIISYSINQDIQCLFLSSWMHWLNSHVVLLKIEYSSSHSVMSLQHWSNDQISIQDISWRRYCSFFWRFSKELDSNKLCRTHDLWMTKKFIFRRVSQIFVHFEYVSMPISDFTDRLLYFFHCSLFISTEKLNISMTIDALEVDDCCMKETSSSRTIIQIQINISISYHIRLEIMLFWFNDSAASKQALSTFEFKDLVSFR